MEYAYPIPQRFTCLHHLTSWPFGPTDKHGRRYVGNIPLANDLTANQDVAICPSARDSETTQMVCACYAAGNTVRCGENACATARELGTVSPVILRWLYFFPTGLRVSAFLFLF